MRPGQCLCLVAALSLGGCGGGVSFGFSGNFFDDIPPSVSLATPATSVRAGDPVRLVAAASDSDSGVDSVTFFRVETQGNTFLGTDRNAPYELTTTAPADGRTSLVVFARARDFDGNVSDSNAVTIVVTP
jgi:hypothetical protein